MLQFRLEFPFCLFAVRYFGALAIARCCLVHRLVLVIKALCVKGKRGPMFLWALSPRTPSLYSP